jgi:hypothetical protein
MWVGSLLRPDRDYLVGRQFSPADHDSGSSREEKRATHRNRTGHEFGGQALASGNAERSGSSRLDRATREGRHAQVREVWAPKSHAP